MSKAKHGEEPSEEVISLSDEDSHAFAEAVINADDPTDYATKAAESYKESVSLVVSAKGKYTHNRCGASVAMQPAMAREFAEGKAFYKSLSCPGCGCARPIAEFTIE